MAAIHETAYPILGDNFKETELWELFTPSDEEIGFINNKVIDVAGRLRMLTLLKVFQHLGYFPMWSAIPKNITNHLANLLGYLFPLDSDDEYDKSGARPRHIQYIRYFLKITPASEQTYSLMEKTAEQAALTKEHLADIINIVIEELVRQHFELPAYSRFYRIAIAARAKVNESCFEIINSKLTAVHKKLLDKWLTKKTEDGDTWWNTLKKEAPSPTVKNFRLYLEHVDWLRKYHDALPVQTNLLDLPDAKRRQFSMEAFACDLPHLQQLKKAKRYVYIILLIEKQVAKVYDDLILMFTRRMYSLKNNAKAALEAYHEKSRQLVSSLIEQLAQIGTAYQIEGTYLKKYRAIKSVMPEKPQDMVESCNQHLAYIQNNYLLCLPRLYKNQRSLLFNCLTNFQLKTSSQDTSLLDAIEFIKKHRNSRKEWLDCTDSNLNLNLVTDKWRKLVTGKTTANAEVKQVHKKYFELYVFFELARELDTGDVFVPQAQQHNDWTQQLISWEEYNEDIEEFGVTSGIPTDSEAFIAKIKGELEEAINRTDQAFPTNQYARLEEGKLILSKLKKKKTAEHYPEIDRLLKERMDNIGILQLLNYTEQSLNLHHRFHHFSGHKSRIPNYASSLVSTLFCYGCFMGPTQTARSIEGASRKQLAWIHDHHVNEERLNNAITKVINAYKQFQLPKFWGTGRSASADGTHWSTYQKNLFTQYHIRYGAYGGVAYYHVADNYIALFSHFIPCGVYEALYILDGLIKNESKLQPDAVYGDTHAQSTVVFGLAYLLGIRLLPRIRGIKNKVFFRPEKDTSYEHIDELFTETINWKLIEKHLPDMLRIVLSIKKGKITPSTILRRLNSQSRKNKLYFAFRELGRAVRTIFLMDYVHDVELRKVIFAATNKSEEFNQFADWAAFANKTIPENMRHEQSKIIKYNHLVANMIMLYNVDGMTRVFNDLAKEEYEITEELIDAFAPYRTEHINRFGSYSKHLNRELLPLQHHLNVNIRRK